jgi:hypothetical protein
LKKIHFEKTATYTSVLFVEAGMPGVAPIPKQPEVPGVAGVVTMVTNVSSLSYFQPS